MYDVTRVNRMLDRGTIGTLYYPFNFPFNLFVSFKW